MVISLDEIEVLKRLSLFRGLGDDEIYGLVGDAVVRSYPRRHSLFIQGDPADRFFVVLAGWAKVYRQAVTGEEIVFQIFGPGDSFAEAAMFGDRDFPASAEIVENARLLEIPTVSFRGKIRQNPDLAFNMLAAMSARLKELTGRMEGNRTGNAPQRVARFLLQICPPDADASGPVTVHLPYDKHLIAARLGMKPETFSRVLKRLQEIDVRVRRNRVDIGDLAGLKEFSRKDR